MTMRKYNIKNKTMKIKIVSRWSNVPDMNELVYDIYYGFSGLLPFCTKWELGIAGFTKDELLKWFEYKALAFQTIIIKL